LNPEFAVATYYGLNGYPRCWGHWQSLQQHYIVCRTHCSV